MIITDIVSVIESEGTEMTDKGNHFSGVCPLHGDGNPSLVVYKNKPERFICFGCGERGDAVDFIRVLHDKSFGGAVRYLELEHNKKAKIKIQPTMIESIVAEEKAGVDVKKKYGKVFIDSLLMKELMNESTKTD